MMSATNVKSLDITVIVINNMMVIGIFLGIVIAVFMTIIIPKI